MDDKGPDPQQLDAGETDGNDDSTVSGIILPGLQSLLILGDFGIGGFHAISGDTNNNGEMNKCWWTNKTS